MNTTNQNNSCFQKRYKGVIKMNNLFEKNIEDLTLEEMEEIKEKFVVEFTNRLLQIAISKIEKLREGEIFFVREIFPGYIWNRIPINIRMRLGTQFFNEVNLNHKNEIEVLDKTKSGQQKYKKLYQGNKNIKNFRK